MGKRHKSFADLKAATLQASPNKKKKPFARQRLEERGIPLEGVSPAIRQDRPGRKNGGRSKETVNVIVAGHPGIAPPIGMMRPPVGPLAAPVGLTPKGGRIGIPKGLADRERVGGVSGSPSFAKGGAVSHGESLRSIRRRTQP